MKNKFGIIVSQYSQGAPIGPMLTSRLYCEQLVASGYGDHVLVLTTDLNVANVKAEFSFADDVTVIQLRSFLPVLLRSTLSLTAISAINNLYKKSRFVTVLWYPGIALALNSLKLSRTAVVMMDSQVRLIKSTSSPKDGPFSYYRRLCVYVYLENRIIKKSPCVAFVSKEDFGKDLTNRTNIVFTRLPLPTHKIDIPEYKKLPPRLLIPRPELDLLYSFLKAIKPYGIFDIHVLINKDLPSLEQEVKHNKFIDNYDEFYREGGLVVLLDKGGAGTTNRSITASRHGLPFIGTLSALRGHEFIFPNCLCHSDNIDTLAEVAAKSVGRLASDINPAIYNYLTEFTPANAVIPLIEKLASLKESLKMDPISPL